MSNPPAFDPVKRTAEISFMLREGIRNALPAPIEQFFTVMVPGKVVNFEDYSEGFDSNGKRTAPILPMVTELNQAILCDDMPVLSPVQLGPTGKSVARSYDAAISKLIPAGTTVGVDIADASNLTDDEERYVKAMGWLTYRDAKKESKTRVETYAEKQKEYTKAVEQKTKAFNDALRRAISDPLNASDEQKRAAYDVWVSENARTYRNLMQAAYMDWVVTGMKEEVEYWFAVVDRDTAMARVEASKEAMRVAVVQDTDGAVEYNTVKLTPSNWAVIAKKKALSGNNQTKTVEWFTWEIARLQKMNAMLQALQERQAPNIRDVPDVDNADLVKAMKAFIDAREENRSKQADRTATAEDKKAAYEAFTAARKTLDDEEAKNTKANVFQINDMSAQAQDEMYKNMSGPGFSDGLIQANNELIKTYTAERKALLDKQNKGGKTLADAIQGDSGIPDAPTEDTPTDESDYFTAISVEISSSSAESSSRSRATSASFGGSVGWGFWGAKVSGSSSYSSGSSEAENSMMSNSCKISFECMRVDIARSWMRPELFYDADLTVGPDEFISPGFGRMRELMEGDVPGATPETIEKELQRYSTFPLYPTAFLMAANVVLEFTGETTAIQTHFQTSSYSASAQVSYGPFGWGGKASSSVGGSNTSTDAACEATAEGCRITIKSPQIIGWVSQMVPALPRLKDQPLP
jgi:hypothetical protein